MKNLNYTYWKDGNWYLGYLVDYPLFGTQGKSLHELEDMLVDLYKELKDNVQPVTAERRNGIITV